MSYGRVFPLLRDANAGSWRDYTRHDFVLALGTGTLPREAFLTYLVQDYLFLVHFARAWALAAVKAGTLEEMRHCTGTVDALLNTEMALHVGICAREGIRETELLASEESLETIAYTRFVLESGYSGDLLDLLVTLVPCVLGYGEIGTQLARGGTDGPYGEWIETYAGPGYQQVCGEVAMLLDGVAQRLLGPEPERSPRWRDLCTTFGTATRLEAEFWSMGLAAGAART